MRRPRVSRSGALRAAAYAVAWLVVAVPVSLWLFTHTSASTTLASHDAVVTPTFDGYATVHLGPFLPDVRAPTTGRIGVDVRLGKTEADSTEELVQRYAFIASKPEGQIRKADEVVRDLALRAALRGALVGLVPVAVWLLLGARRRSDLWVALRSRRGVVAVWGVVLLVLGLVQPWSGDRSSVESGRVWVPLATVVPDVPLPKEVARIQVRADLTTSTTRRLVLSAVDTYDRSKAFYEQAAKDAARLELHRPAQGETVALLISDRHDNIGMDAVARAIFDRGRATAVIDAGDDTSTGSEWEAFSLDSLDDAFDDVKERFAISGNHDNGTFVSKYLAEHGWTHLTGDVVKGPGGSRMMGVDDPRSSGLGTWRDEKGLTFAEQRTRIADAACKADADGDRVAVLVVHDANSANEALTRGCVDLVLSGHLHVQVGPNRVVGDNGEVGWRYTNGTTGGAAYAIAVGSKLRREAEVTLVTYAGGRVVGLQPVRLQTDGVFVVGAYRALTYAASSD